MNQYLNINQLKRNNNMLICRALLKHGHRNFSLEILKYCSPAKCLKWEQFYLDLLKPSYNILKIAGSLLGFKHSEKSRAKISAAMFGKTRSEETRGKISASHEGIPKP
jgi:group I intron endonuclease